MFGGLAYWEGSVMQVLGRWLVEGNTLLLRLQGYQTCVSAGMLAPGLANAVLAQHFVLGVFGALSVHFGSLLEKHLFLGRTLLLRLQGYQTCVGAGMLVPGLANAVLV